MPTKDVPPKKASSHWLWGVSSLFHNGQEFIDFLFNAIQEQGDVVRMDLGLVGDIFRKRRGSAAYFLNDPHDIKHVLVTKDRNYPKDLSLLAFTPDVIKVFGQGLVTSNDPLHAIQRRVMQPFFNRQHIANYADLVVEKAAHGCQSWAAGGTVDLSLEMSRLTMTIASQAFFNMDMETQSDTFTQAVRVAQQCLAESYYSPLSYLPGAGYLPTAHNRRFRRVLTLLNQEIRAAINKRRTNSERGQDMLSALLEAQEHGQPSMSDQQIRDEVVTLGAALK